MQPKAKGNGHLEGQNQRNTKPEFFMEGFVVKNLHSQQSPNASPRRRKQKQIFFRDAADGLLLLLPLGFPLVQTEGEERNDVDENQPTGQKSPGRTDKSPQEIIMSLGQNYRLFLGPGG